MSFQTVKSSDSKMDQNTFKLRHTIMKFQTFGRKYKSLQAPEEKRSTLTLNLSSNDTRDQEPKGICLKIPEE